MKKKLQIFVSSTYTDLLSERQAAVEAILKAGHIPAGMELFAAGDRSQWETIKHWIDESDVFMLILGGRYGSIDPESGKSYTQLEYEYAALKQMPMFAVVMSDKLLAERVKSSGQAALELANRAGYDAFKATVLARICRFFDDPKDLKLSVHETLFDFLSRHSFKGWISGSQAEDFGQLARQIARLTEENSKLETRVKELSEEGFDYNAIVKELFATKVKYKQKSGKVIDIDALSVVAGSATSLITGVDNHIHSGDAAHFIYFNIAPVMAMHGLMEQKPADGGKYQRFVTTAKGNRFLARLATDARKGQTVEADSIPAKTGVAKTRKNAGAKRSSK